MFNYILAFTAGIISILSPCILPLLPILIGSGVQSSGIKGVLGLPLGMALSFSSIGIALAYTGHFMGIDSSSLSVLSSIFLIIFGLIICIDKIQKSWINFSQNLSNKFSNLANKVSTNNFLGQFFIGLLLGIAWTPCIGPIIGAAITLASKGQHLLHVALTMILFAVGATLPIILMTFLSKKSLYKFKPRLQFGGRYAKIIFGLLLILWGIILLFNIDKQISAWLLPLIPSWMFRYI